MAQPEVVNKVVERLTGKGNPVLEQKVFRPLGRKGVITFQNNAMVSSTGGSTCIEGL